MSREKTSKDPDVQLSKLLSYTLRHGAKTQGLHISADGYVCIDDILGHPQYSRYRYSDIIRVVNENSKKRFQVEYIPFPNATASTSISDTQPNFIRAVQGHSMESIDSELLLLKIDNASDLPVCVHGTYSRFMESIMEKGLSKMGRNLIHMAIGQPHEVMSGARKDVDVLIYINVPLAMADGIIFYRSPNNVILSSGIEESGFIPSKYFEKVVSYDHTQYKTK